MPGAWEDRRMNLSTIFDWITVRDYDKAKADGQRRIVSRFARGNVLIQRGRYIDDIDAQELVRRGDRATERLERTIHVR